MEQIAIPGTGVHVSRVGLGTWAIGGWMWGGSEEGESVRTIHTALAKGINLLDTAPIYGFGRSEKTVGRAIEEYGSRHKVVIATKVGLEWLPDGSIMRNGSARHICQEVGNSLRRLRTDYIDIYQVHWPDEHVPIEETAEAMARLYDEGKIRAIGVSNFSPQQMDRFRVVAPLHVISSSYSLFDRQGEKYALPYARSNHITAITFGTLCRGLLSGMMTKEREFAGDDLRNIDPRFQSPQYERYLSAVERLDEFARERFGRQAIDLAIRWVLEQPSVSAVLWGARHPAQLDRAESALEWSIPNEDMCEIARIVHSMVPDETGRESSTERRSEALVA